MTRSRMILVGGTAALVVLLALSWILVLAPRLGQPAEIQAMTESAEAQTARLNTEIASLQAIQQDLPAHIAQFTELRGNFPTTAEIPATLDQIRAAATAAGVTLDSLENGVPTLLVAEAAATTTDGTSEEVPAAEDGSADAGSVGVAGSGGNLASMAVSVTVSGTYAEVTAFLQEVQGIPRAWLVDTVTTQGGQEGNTVSLTASGAMYILDTTAVEVPQSGTSTAPAPAAGVSTVPAPASGVSTVPPATLPQA